MAKRSLSKAICGADDYSFEQTCTTKYYMTANNAKVYVVLQGIPINLATLPIFSLEKWSYLLCSNFDKIKVSALLLLCILQLRTKVLVP